MLPALLLAALVATQAVPAEPQIPTKKDITEAFKELEMDTNTILHQLPNRLGFDPDEPKLGVTMETRELGLGSDNLPARHTYVTGVFVPSGAYTAGIQPGDRIFAVGKIKLQTQLPRAVMFYMEEYPDGIPLTLERAGKQFPVTLKRQPLTCAKLVWRTFEVASWQKSVETLRELIRGKIAAIEAASELTQEEHAQACIDVIATAELIRDIVIDMARQLEPSLSPLCTVQRAAP